MGMSNAMSVRHAAAHAVFDKEADVVQAARTVMFTHRNSEALGGGEFFARVTHKIIHDGMMPREAIEAAAKTMGKWYVDKAKQGIAKFEEATDPIKVGKASPTEGTLPTSVYLILKYQDNFEAGVKANAMIGGDNASRAVAVGLVLGAWNGVKAVPEDLQTTLNAWKKCDKMLNKLPLLSAGGKGEEL